MATLGIGKGCFVGVMTDDDIDTPVSESQVEEGENELPVIQLYGLVEELRYWRPLLPVWAQTLVQHGDIQVRVEH